MRQDIGRTILPYLRSFIISYMDIIAVAVPLTLALIISLVSFYKMVIIAKLHFGGKGRFSLDLSQPSLGYSSKTHRLRINA